ncbi:PRC-barrel domain-containing protein [uncultured Methanobrevibacter sp.]|uniref:PRC-barrel domain-containing protein n=1 Tax=uncultured Methanobrevibacter sp. TaxID=253161 RepID=UPI002636D400
MKIKQLLGKEVLDSNANIIGKIVDAEFEPAEGKVTGISILLKKNIISSNQIDVPYEDIKSVGDYVLLNIEINKDAAFEEAEKAKKEAKEAERAAKEAERAAAKEAKEAEKAAKKAEEEAAKEAEAVEAEIVEEAEEEEEEAEKVDIE